MSEKIVPVEAAAVIDDGFEVSLLQFASFLRSEQDFHEDLATARYIEPLRKFTREDLRARLQQAL